jgi:hypothetical protein
MDVALTVPWTYATAAAMSSTSDEFDSAFSLASADDEFHSMASLACTISAASLALETLPRASAPRAPKSISLDREMLGAFAETCAAVLEEDAYATFAAATDVEV